MSGNTMQPKSPTCRWNWQALLILLLSLIFVLAGLRTVIMGETAKSRLATVYSLTHQNTWLLLPDNPFAGDAVDKVKVGDIYLSSKPPILPLLMTAEYYFLHHGLGWSLENKVDLRHTLQVMILSFTIFPFLLGLIFFYRLMCLFEIPPSHRWLPLAALALGTQLPGYAPHLNNHIPAAALLIIAIYYAVGLGAGKLAPTWWRFALYGLTGALVFTLDMPVTIFVAFAGIYLLWKHPKQAMIWCGAGMFLPLAVHFSIMIALTGSPLPVQMHMEEGWYLYENAYWRNPGGIDALNHPPGQYLFNITFGRFGIFLMYPVLLSGLMGVIAAVTRKNLPYRGLILAGFGAFSVLTLYYCFKTNNYGGAAYGFRWYIGAMPVLLMMGLPLFQALCKKWQWALMLLLLAVSIYTATECWLHPWGSCHEWPSRLFFGPIF